MSVGSIAPDRHDRDARPMSASPPVAVKHWHRSETPLRARSQHHSQFELRWLLNGKISRLVSIENTGSVNANLAICVRKAGAVAYKAARCCELTPLVNCGYRVLRRQRDKLIALPCKKRLTGNQERCRCAGEGGNQVQFATGLRDNNSLPDGLSRLLHFT